MRKVICFEEYETKEIRLSDDEFKILKTDFKKRIRVLRIEKGKYSITARQYVGNIVLPNHVFIIRPKIPNLNFFNMLFHTYDIVPEFKRKDWRYEKEPDVFELLVVLFLEDVEILVKKGISKGYVEAEDNISFLRGRVLLREELGKNQILKHRIYCRFSDFSSDTVENRLVKFTLYQLSQISFRNKPIVTMTRQLIHFFEPISLVAFSERNFPEIKYNRLTERYKPIINLCRLIIQNSAVNFQKTGEFHYSSFLVDMNKLFENFLLGILKGKLKEFKVRSAGRGLSEYALDVKGTMRQNPDILVRKGGKDVLVIDAKYKKLQSDGKNQNEKIIADVRQVWSYCLVPQHKLPFGVLVYPKHLIEQRVEEVHSMKYYVTVVIKTIDLTGNSKEFKRECVKFQDSIEELLNVVDTGKPFLTIRS